MIRRIVDSVALMDASGFHQEFVDVALDSSLDDSKSDYILIGDDNPDDASFISSRDYATGGLLVNSSTFAKAVSVERSLDLIQLDMFDRTTPMLPKPAINRLSNGVSCYIAPKRYPEFKSSELSMLTPRPILGTAQTSLPASASSSSSPSSSMTPSLSPISISRRARKQSPSPNGCPPKVDRPLPSGLHSTRPNRFTKLPTRKIAELFEANKTDPKKVKQPTLSKQLAEMELFNPELAKLGQMKSVAVVSSEFCSSMAQSPKREDEKEICMNQTNSSYLISNGTAMQADPLVMSVELIVLPFVQDLKEVELRLAASKLNTAQKRILKTLAREHEFTILTASTPSLGSKTSWLTSQTVELVLRKRATLVQRQEIEWGKRRQAAVERARLETEKKREAEANAKLLRETAVRNTVPQYRESCCQAIVEETPVKPSRKQQRRQRQTKRRELWEAKKALESRPKKVDCASQTVPEDHWLCPWCWEHIAPEVLCGHEAICRAEVKQREMTMAVQLRLKQRNADFEARKRQRLGLPVKNLSRMMNGQTCKGDVTAVQVKPGQLAGMSARSQSRTRLIQRGKNKSKTRQRSSSRTDPNRQNTVVAKLDSVHPNDLGAMTRLMQRICTAPGCRQLASSNTSFGDTVSSGGGTKCASCRRIFCDRHRPVGLHADCPGAIAKASREECQTAGIACGMDLNEKKASLKSAMRQRRAMLMERRQRC